MQLLGDHVWFAEVSRGAGASDAVRRCCGEQHLFPRFLFKEGSKKDVFQKFDRLERLYLGALRGFVLVAATVLLIATAVFGFDSLRRSLIVTEVEPAATTVVADDLLPTITPDRVDKQAEASQAAAVPDWAKQKHAEFMKGPFENYYRTYRGLASRFNKPEDAILTKSQLATELGYTAEILAQNSAFNVENMAASIEAPVVDADAEAAFSAALLSTSAAFQQDAAYAKSASETVAAVVGNVAVTGQLQRYKAAQKTDQRCSTTYRNQRGWDSNSMACSNWYEQPIGCPVVRPVPVETCEAAYPAGIKSPLGVFKEVDNNYRQLWSEKTASAAAVAAAEAEKRAASKAEALPTLLRGAVVLGVFFLLMFVFLAVAIERHLRRMSTEKSRDVQALPYAAE